jgi:iron(III) transport system ATP-binding protein
MNKAAGSATRGDAGLPRLALDEVTCVYGPFTAVDRLSLDIMPGEFISLLGPSGCGKTTTLRMIAGFIQPTAGTIAMDGEIISAPRSTLAPEKRQMSMIFQSYAVWPNMTVAENVAFGLELRRFDRATIARKVQEVLETVRLTALAGRYPAELSGGQQQRVALARAIVIQPRVLLLDEPLSNLDANLREEMRYEIRRLHNAYKFTTVYVTHDQAEAMVTSDRIAVMNQGRLEQIDAPYALYTRPRTRFVAGFIGRTNFLDGVCAGDLVNFDRFAFPRACLGDGLAKDGRILFSVRPQSLKLHRASPTGGSPLIVESRLVERAFLGETWEYIVAPGDGDLRLRATTPPNQIFEAGEVVWLEFDPAQMVAVA